MVPEKNHFIRTEAEVGVDGEVDDVRLPIPARTMPAASKITTRRPIAVFSR